MDIKKNIGIVFVVTGIILTLDRTEEFNGIVTIIVYYLKEYWPLLITVLGIYLLALPKNKKKR